MPSSQRFAEKIKVQISTPKHHKKITFAEEYEKFLQLFSDYEFLLEV